MPSRDDNRSLSTEQRWIPPSTIRRDALTPESRNDVIFRKVRGILNKLTAKLEAPKEESLSLENIKPLSEVMTVDKIAAIKAKRLAKKRSSIKENCEIGIESDLRVILDMDVCDTKNIVSRERQWRTRTTILQTRKRVN